MTRGPLNRVIGTLGLLALVPTAVMSATGTLTAADTAVRAGVTLLLAIAVKRLAAWYIATTAASFEKRTDQDDEVNGPTAAAPSLPPRRRRVDAEGDEPGPSAEATIG